MSEASQIPWPAFLVSAAASISPQLTVESAMGILCEVLSSHPEGVSSSLDGDKFVQMTRLCAEKLNVPEKRIREAEDYLKRVAAKQQGKLMPNNFRAVDCPSLE